MTNTSSLTHPMNNRRTTAYLSLSGLLLLVIGATLLLAPHAIHASNGVSLGDNPSLLSEIGAPGGMLAVSGAVALIAVFSASLRRSAMLLSVLIYASFGMARLLSIAMDGIPPTTIVGATALELALALAGLALLWRR